MYLKHGRAIIKSCSCLGFKWNSVGQRLIHEVDGAFYALDYIDGCVCLCRRVLNKSYDKNPIWEVPTKGVKSHLFFVSNDKIHFLYMVESGRVYLVEFSKSLKFVSESDGLAYRDMFCSSLKVLHTQLKYAVLDGNLSRDAISGITSSFGDFEFENGVLVFNCGEDGCFKYGETDSIDFTYDEDCGTINLSLNDGSKVSFPIRTWR